MKKFCSIFTLRSSASGHFHLSFFPFPIALSLLLLLTVWGCNEGGTEVSSPDGNILVRIDNEGKLSYSVTFRGEELVTSSGLGLKFRDLGELGEGLSITGTDIRLHSEKWEREWGRDKQVIDEYNELVCELENPGNGLKLNMIFRVYNDGVAFRYQLPAQVGMKDFELIMDETEFSFPAEQRVWAAHYGSFKSHQEAEFIEMSLNDDRMKEITGMPLLVKAGQERWLAITEANLTDWAGMYVRLKEENTLETVLAPWPDDPELLVKSSAPRNSPWRLIMIADSPGDFLESDILANLNEPCKLKDVSWIKPGISAWDWWWCNRYCPDVDFELGSNQQTMKHFIDLAAEMGWEYQLVDWFWYGPPHQATEDDWSHPNPDADILTPNPDIDIPELVQYAAERGVKILVWLEWHHADRQMEEAFPLYEKWGVAGVKVDFMQRDDQYVVNFYHRLVKLAAQHHLVVDFHGAYKPTGISRTWPNLLTREGIMGNEYAKWSHRITPEHKVTIPFTRGILGEMDFTPGAFVNVSPENHKTESESPTPMTMGTRCNELAMLIVYDSPLQVMCDAPYNYRSSPRGTDFLRIVPTTWDETRVLNAAVGDYITVARRSGEDWFVGSMVDWNERNLEIPLEFLGKGKYTATIWQDTDETREDLTRLEINEREVDNSVVIRLDAAPGGGQVIHLKKISNQ